MNRNASFSALLATVVLLAANQSVVRAQDISEKGQIKIGSHEIAMKAGQLYLIKVESKDFQPQVSINPGFLAYVPQDFNKKGFYSSHYFPKENATHTITVLPQVFGLNAKGPLDYTIDVKSLKIGAKPELDVKDELADTDPPFKTDFGNRPHHKSFKVPMKANTYYIIDMKQVGDVRLDSFLYLLDPNGKMVSSDDDGGGFPSARIVYQVPNDGEYRIIATGLGQALGGFNLTVRTPEKK